MYGIAIVVYKVVLIHPYQTGDKYREYIYTAEIIVNTE